MISGNLANVNTNGYKSLRPNFQEILDDMKFTGVHLQSTQRMMQQGNLTPTENPLNLAISGDGFFAVELETGEIAYTRDGEFHLDSALNIVNGRGLQLEWEGEIPENTAEVRVNQDGRVLALMNDGSGWVEAGTISLYRVQNPSGLNNYGQSLWLPTEISGEITEGVAGTTGYGRIVGYTIESSNVDVA
mgnify:CR=1 FL=1